MSWTRRSRGRRRWLLQEMDRASQGQVRGKGQGCGDRRWQLVRPESEDVPAPAGLRADRIWDVNRVPIMAWKGYLEGRVEGSSRRARSSEGAL